MAKLHSRCHLFAALQLKAWHLCAGGVEEEFFALAALGGLVPAAPEDELVIFFEALADFPFGGAVRSCASSFESEEDTHQVTAFNEEFLPEFEEIVSFGGVDGAVAGVFENDVEGAFKICG